MSSSHHLILRCDAGTRGARCLGYHIGSASLDIAAVRESAKAKGWTFKPGNPYPHIGATDLCREHSTTTRPAGDTPAPGAATTLAAARTATR